MRQIQPHKTPREKSPKGPRQAIPNEAARLQARLAGRPKKAGGDAQKTDPQDGRAD